MLKNLEQEYSLKQQEVNESLKGLENIFDQIKSDFATNDMFYEVDVYSSFSHELRVKIKAKVLKWSGDVIDVTIRFDCETYKMSTDFNHDSGGWNPGFETIDKLKMFASAITASVNIVDIAKNNQSIILSKLKKHNELSLELSRIGGDIYRIKSDEKKELLTNLEQSVLSDLVSELGYDTISTGQDIIDILLKDAKPTDDLYSYIRVGRIVSKDGKFSIRKELFSVEKYSKTVFKVDYKRISKKDLTKMKFNSHFIIPIEQHHNTVFYSGSALTMEEIKGFLS